MDTVPKLVKVNKGRTSSWAFVAKVSRKFYYAIITQNITLPLACCFHRVQKEQLETAKMYQSLLTGN